MNQAAATLTIVDFHAILKEVTSLFPFVEAEVDAITLKKIEKKEKLVNWCQG